MDASPDKKISGRYLAVLSLSALGVVYGDIGTSPLYALRECFHLKHGVAATPDNIIGILSLICWSLMAPGVRPKREPNSQRFRQALRYEANRLVDHAHVCS